MKLVTFQPIKVWKQLEAGNTYYPPADGMYGPYVFCLALNEQTMQSLYHTSPTMPQMLLVLDVPVIRISRIDCVQWVNSLNGFPARKPTYKHCEYTIKYLSKSDVVDTQLVSKSNSPDIVQDAFLDMHFPVIEEASGYRWRRFADMGDTDFDHCLKAIMRVMYPFGAELTDEEVDKVEDEICNYFRIGEPGSQPGCIHPMRLG